VSEAAVIDGLDGPDDPGGHDHGERAFIRSGDCRTDPRARWTLVRNADRNCLSSHPMALRRRYRSRARALAAARRFGSCIR
ncbi:MAG: hypothetical protein OXE82_04950, partial [Rhodobacter sp.]|nr:hypothetical protein [Rhodobacter sp.]